MEHIIVSQYELSNEYEHEEDRDEDEEENENEILLMNLVHEHHFTQNLYVLECYLMYLGFYICYII